MEEEWGKRMRSNCGGEKRFDVGEGEAVTGSEFEMKYTSDYLGFGK